ncbi:MAG: hypothetical protein JNM10_06775 [Planctomycetia bacterium]|nr:hypothetical protein [Planctomycetia bacterium]
MIPARAIAAVVAGGVGWLALDAYAVGLAALVSAEGIAGATDRARVAVGSGLRHVAIGSVVGLLPLVAAVVGYFATGHGRRGAGLASLALAATVGLHAALLALGVAVARGEASGVPHLCWRTWHGGGSMAWVVLVGAGLRAGVAHRHGLP